MNEYRHYASRQLAGVENIEGSYPFTLANSVKAYRLNRFLHRMIEPGYRGQFLADPEPLFEEHALTAEERDMVRRRDLRAMIHYGVIFFMLEKLGAVVGVSNLHIYAAMRVKRWRFSENPQRTGRFVFGCSGGAGRISLVGEAGTAGCESC